MRDTEGRARHGGVEARRGDVASCAVLALALAAPGRARASDDPPSAPSARAALDVDAPEPPSAPKSDILANARSLSRRGDRAGALELLSSHLEARPTDTDARTVYGLILSWEGRYDEAREQLACVLKEVPGHHDATRAAIKVELWSDHPDRAEEMANDALEHTSDRVDLLLERARARFARNDLDGARADLDHVLALEPDNDDAASLKRRVLAAGRVWSVGSSYSFDAFSDGRSPWHEVTVQAKRLTPLGSVIVRGYEAWRFDTSDNQVEIEAFPSLWKGAYGDLAGAVSPNAALYPSYRVQVDVYQSLPFGFEVSLGYRHLQFNHGVNMGVAAVSRYLGDWLISVRSLLTPGVDGTSASIFGSVRYYFRETAYVGVRTGYGLSHEEIRSVNDTALLGSATVGTEAFGVLFDRLEIGARGAVSMEARFDRSDLWQFGVSTSVGFLF
ncbi:MAG: YaiO family outer membrane beta-barrel protein [Byssovorax sp.]